MIGIYKITSPSGKVYIGQSVNIEARKKKYSSLSCKRQPRIYRSLKKHGYEKHQFDVLIECVESELNAHERYYQELYQSTGKNGLNCMLVSDNNVGGRHSIETRAKIKAAHTGRKQTEEHRNKITASKIGRKRCPVKTALRAKKRIKPLINRETGETYCSVKEAAEKLGIKTNTLYGAIHAETRGLYKNKYNICYA